MPIGCLVRKPNGRRRLGSHIRKRDDSNKLDLRQIG
jgi:hypothetical protein